MSQLPDNYIPILNLLKEKIRTAKMRAVLSANAHMLMTYWEIGHAILQQQDLEGWGTKVIDRLGADLRAEFPDIKGLSERNLKYMRAFAEAYPEFVQQPVAQLQLSNNQEIEIMQQAVAQLPWGHHTVILTKLKQKEERLFYIRKCIENNWSRNVLVSQIESNLVKRVGGALNNFSVTLPAPQSDLANEVLKNPYVLDFIVSSEKMQERDLENALIAHIEKFMLELGKGFAFVGRQYLLKVEEDEYFIDLLFYNTHLHCYVVVELKIGEFKPEYAGKLNFYINAVDVQVKRTGDAPTIGILLCKTPNETVVKYALQNVSAPMGVSEYQLAQALPNQLKGEIPTVEELEAEIEKEYEELKSPSQKKFDALKEKLSQLKGDEIKQTATTPILFELVDKSLLPLYQSLLKRLEDFKELFVSSNYSWHGKDRPFSDINILAEQWKDENFLKNNFNFYFTYRLNGFKKAGTEAFDIVFQFDFRVDTYWYGFILLNYNNQQPFLKKQYHEQLTTNDIDLIVDTIYNVVIDDIERRVNSIIEK